MVPYESIRIKIGDIVSVHAGRSKGHIGRVIKIIKAKGQVFVREANMIVRHVKKRPGEEQGKRLTKEGAIDLSNVQLYCTHCKKGVRHFVQFEVVEKKRFDDVMVPLRKKKRMCRVCRQELLWQEGAESVVTPETASVE